MRIEGAFLGGLYSPPGASWSGFEQALGLFNRTATGKEILLDDFNGRHSAGAAGSNPRGRKLVAWTYRHRWQFRTPANPTHCNSNDARTTLDFAISKAGTVRRVTSRQEWHNTYGGSDHAPVLMQWWGRVAEMRVNDRRIPASTRSDLVIVNAPTDWLHDELPRHIQELQHVDSQQKLVKWYEGMVQCMLAPCGAFGPRKAPRVRGAFGAGSYSSSQDVGQRSGAAGSVMEMKKQRTNTVGWTSTSSAPRGG